MLGPIEIGFFLIVAVLIAVVVVARGFQIDESSMARWADSANVMLTDASRPVVRRYLAWSRRCRTAGLVVGFLTPVIVSAVIGKPDDPGPWAVSLMVVGYLLGALAAEFVINCPDRGSGTALLVPRRLSDYLPAYVLVLQRGLAAIAVVLVPVYALVEPHARFVTPSIPAAAAFGIGAACLTVLIEVLERRIVGRRQPVTDTTDLTLDDAMRSSSLHVLAGAGIAVLIFVASLMVAISIATVASEAVSTAVGVAFILLVLPTSIFFWIHLARPNGFRVRRGRTAEREARGLRMILHVIPDPPCRRTSRSVPRWQPWSRLASCRSMRASPRSVSCRRTSASRVARSRGPIGSSNRRASSPPVGDMDPSWPRRTAKHDEASRSRHSPTRRRRSRRGFANSAPTRSAPSSSPGRRSSPSARAPTSVDSAHLG